MKKKSIEKISKIKYEKKNPIPLIDIDEDEIPFQRKQKCIIKGKLHGDNKVFK